MGYETIVFDRAQGVATVTLNRPQVLNAINRQMLAELAEALELVERDESVRALILTGAGSAFCAGQDLGERKGASTGSPVDLKSSIVDRYNPLLLAIASLPKPVICAVNGTAAGAGANIALACDVTLASEAANFIEVFVNVGLMPDCGGSWLLPRLAGQQRAMAMMLSGEPLGAADAARWGLIWRCVPDDALAATAQDFASRLATRAPLAVAATKAAVRSCWSRTLEEQLALEGETNGRLGNSKDYAEGVRSFSTKTRPRFTGA